MWRHEAVDNVEDLVFGDIYHHTYDGDCDGLPMHSYISLATGPADSDYGVGVACLVIGLPGSSLWTHPESSDICHIWWEPDD